MGVQSAKGPYNKKEGYGVVYVPMVSPTNYLSISPPVNKGYDVSYWDAKYANRWTRPRYYTSTPSGLPY